MYLFAGHAFHTGQSMAEASIGPGICIVLVTVVALAFVRTPPKIGPGPLGALAVSLGLVAQPVPLRATARTSPAWLQRFLD